MIMIIIYKEVEYLFVIFFSLFRHFIYKIISIKVKCSLISSLVKTMKQVRNKKFF